MNHIQFGACEFCFPVWGALAIEMAHDAGFQGMQITDGGGYLQPHPLNNGFVEYERFGLDLRRKDSFPLTDEWVQNDYLEAAAKFGMTLTGIDLYLLDRQGFVKFASGTPQGRQCLETIQNAVHAAAQMNIPSVTIPLRGMFGVGQHAYALQKLQYAAEVGREYGVQILAAADTGLGYRMEIMDALQGAVKLDFNTIDPLVTASGSAAEMIAALGTDRIGRFRFRDLSADSEGFVTRETGRAALLGQGDGGFLSCAEAVKSSGYSGWVLSETAYYSVDLNVGGEDYVSLARQDVQTLKTVFHAEAGRVNHGQI